VAFFVAKVRKIGKRTNKRRANKRVKGRQEIRGSIPLGKKERG